MNGKIYVYFNKKKYENEGIKKYYVGQTTRSIEERAGRNGWKYCKSGNTKFSNSIKKWGWDSFEVTVLEEGIKTWEGVTPLHPTLLGVPAVLRASSPPAPPCACPGSGSR